MRCCLLVACCLILGPVAWAGTSAPPTLEQQILGILAKRGLSASDCGVYAAPLGRAPLAALNADKPLIPASNKKLVTTAAALDLLGPGYQFVTRVLSTGPIEAGVLKGDLVIVGGGDPSLAGRWHEDDALAVPKRWIEHIKAAGVERIEGDIVADDSILDRQLVHPTWPGNQLDKWYCAPVSGLAYNDDCIDITVAPGKAVGSPAVVRLSPPTGYFTVENRCLTVAKESQHEIVLGRRAGSRNLVITGKCWAKAEPLRGPVAVDDPGLMLATVMCEQLRKSGVEVSGQPVVFDRNAERPEGIELCRTTSDLASCVLVANKRSQNLYAELMHKLMGAVIEGDGSFAGGNRALAGFLGPIGIETGTYVSADGSGMSRANRITARQIGTILMHMADHPSSSIFIDSLPMNGSDGTLRKRVSGESLAGRIRAKTGYIRNVHALSGYVTSTLGEPQWVFSILMNHRKGNAKGAQDDICRLLAGLSPAEDRRSEHTQ